MKTCALCGAEFVKNKAQKFCASCRESNARMKMREYWKAENYKLAHRKTALKWQKTHKEKVRAQSIAKANPHLLNILFECACESTKKVNHHPDYSRPYDVIRLCEKCHREEHARLRAIQKSALSAQAEAI
jgi:pterin-4a-carbinolamine dehydratase